MLGKGPPVGQGWPFISRIPCACCGAWTSSVFVSSTNKAVAASARRQPGRRPAGNQAGELPPAFVQGPPGLAQLFSHMGDERLFRGEGEPQSQSSMRACLIRLGACVFFRPKQWFCVRASGDCTWGLSLDPGIQILQNPATTKKVARGLLVFATLSPSVACFLSGVTVCFQRLW